jgi:hypothetical protein
VREKTGRVPPVIDARDVLVSPEAMLKELCDAVGVAFVSSMLSWPSGARSTDGIWARHWYDAVEASTEFAPYQPKDDRLPERLGDVLAECQQFYDRLSEHRIRAN